MRFQQFSSLIVLGLVLSIVSVTSAGIKGGTLSIKSVTPTVYERMNRRDSLIKSSSETLTLKDNRRFACLRIEVAIDWSDNDKATEHTILKKLIRLKDHQNKELPLIGRHAGNGDFIESISSHIHLQRKDGNPYFGDLVFAIPTDLGTCTLHIKEAKCEISIPERVMEPVYKPVAKFKFIYAAMIDELPCGQLPRPNEIFQSTIKPVKGKILEVVLEIEPLASTRQRRASAGFYSDKRAFSLSTADIGILLNHNLYLDSIAAQMKGKAYERVSSYQSFREKWLTITKKVYFCVPADLKDFRITYDQRPVAEGRVGGGYLHL